MITLLINLLENHVSPGSPGTGLPITATIEYPKKAVYLTLQQQQQQPQQ
jgi:hypothetical protein